MKRLFIIIPTIIILIVFISGVIIYYDIESGFWITERNISETLHDQKRIFRIKIDEEARYPHTIHLNINGKIDGKGILSYGLSESNNYIIDTISNEFSLDYSADWYADSCKIIFDPLHTTKGTIKIDCKIYSGRH